MSKNSDPTLLHAVAQPASYGELSVIADEAKRRLKAADDKVRKNPAEAITISRDAYANAAQQTRAFSLDAFAHDEAFMSAEDELIEFARHLIRLARSSKDGEAKAIAQLRRHIVKSHGRVWRFLRRERQDRKIVRALVLALRKGAAATVASHIAALKTYATLKVGDNPQAARTITGAWQTIEKSMVKEKVALARQRIEQPDSAPDESTSDEEAGDDTSEVDEDEDWRSGGHVAYNHSQLDRLGSASNWLTQRNAAFVSSLSKEERRMAQTLAKAVAETSNQCSALRQYCMQVAVQKRIDPPLLARWPYAPPNSEMTTTASTLAPALPTHVSTSTPPISATATPALDPVTSTHATTALAPASIATAHSNTHAVSSAADPPASPAGNKRTAPASLDSPASKRARISDPTATVQSQAVAASGASGSATSSDVPATGGRQATGRSRRPSSAIPPVRKSLASTKAVPSLAQSKRASSSAGSRSSGAQSSTSAHVSGQSSQPLRHSVTTNGVNSGLTSCKVKPSYATTHRFPLDSRSSGRWSNSGTATLPASPGRSKKRAHIGDDGEGGDDDDDEIIVCKPIKKMRVGI